MITVAVPFFWILPCKKVADTLKSVNKMKQKKHQYKIAWFNCQGILTCNEKRTMLANDFENYRLDVLAMQLAHLSP